MNKPIFIAEIKTKSMFGFESPYSRAKLIDTALEHGDWISVHTDPRFGGSFDDIYMLARETRKPILAKGFHCHNDDIKKALDLGADYVLVVERATMSHKHVLFEFSEPVEGFRMVYNSRDLRTGQPKKVNRWHEYRVKCDWLCAASNIKVKDDVQIMYPGCDAFIVGSNLVEFCESLKG